jgi:hypothetical protein
VGFHRGFYVASTVMWAHPQQQERKDKAAEEKNDNNTRI